MIEADNLVQNLLEAARKDQTPAIDVGEVNGYTQGKHLTTLNYGQTPPPDNTAPSVTARVEKNNGAALNNKPIASPFAWQKCGLIIPVYPGMRALLGHNLDLTNDAVVVGFLWSEVEGAEQQPPKNEPGDYWLCLPTQLGADQQPMGKGVNDLTDKSGLRVIQAKGLRIFVGDKGLPEVGNRPDVPDAQTIEIKHQSGTKIYIDSNGALNIELAQKQGITMKSGNNTVKVSDQGIEINAISSSGTPSSSIKLNSDGTSEISSTGILQIKASQVNIS